MRNKIKEMFGNYRIHGVPTREDGCIILQEGMEENEYAAQYQRVILESTAGVKVSFELMTYSIKTATTRADQILSSFTVTSSFEKTMTQT